MTTFRIPKTDRERLAANLHAFVLAALPGKELRVEVSEYRKRRSDDQNRYLWGCVYPSILKGGGEQLGGWTAEDLHDFFLIEHFGSEIIEGFGRKRHRALRRSSKLSTVEFKDLVEHIQRFCAERGIYVPDPDEA